MNRIMMFCAGLLLVCSMSGCCLLGGCGYGAAYPGYGNCGSCGGCATGYQGAYGPAGPTAFAPAPTTAYNAGYPVAMETLPTYQ